MLVTMLARSLCLTFHSPNQRIQPRDGKEEKPRKGLFLWLSTHMIQHLDPDRFYSDRSYLTEWFHDDLLVVTDNDFENIQTTQQLLAQHANTNRILDITHNPWPDDNLPLSVFPVLTNNFKYWYTPDTDRTFFPLFLWMYSLRRTLWWPGFSFDTHNRKTEEIMCLNNRPRPHRTLFWDEFHRRGIIDRMTFSFVEPCYFETGFTHPYPMLLPDETPDSQRNDVGVGHSIYSKCAVNLVTETAVDLTYISEKTCKPFVARQIPIIACSVSVNKFLEDVGLDMFSDIVPWKNWDSETDNTLRMTKIAEFVEQWLRSGTILDDYRRVLDRVERNKQYFHSEAFRNCIMIQMDQFKS